MKTPRLSLFAILLSVMSCSSDKVTVSPLDQAALMQCNESTVAQKLVKRILVRGKKFSCPIPPKPAPNPTGIPCVGNDCPNPTSTPIPIPTGTPYPSPTGTPYPTPTGTPYPTPTGTPYPSPGGSPYASPSPVPVKPLCGMANMYYWKNSAGKIYEALIVNPNGSIAERRAVPASFDKAGITIDNVGSSQRVVFCEKNSTPTFPSIGNPYAENKHSYIDPLLCLHGFARSGNLLVRYKRLFDPIQLQYAMNGHDPDCFFTTASPLVLDYSQRGIETVSIKDGISFDHNSNGYKENTGWVTGDSPFLALDLNGDGAITHGGELFGDNTKLANGSKAANGFEALKEYDLNRDGAINARDKIYQKLLLWFDKNQNGVSERSELLPLYASSIAAISTKYSEVYEEDDYGNVTKQRGAFSFKNGKIANIIDLWFLWME